MRLREQWTIQESLERARMPAKRQMTGVKRIENEESVISEEDKRTGTSNREADASPERHRGVRRRTAVQEAGT